MAVSNISSKLGTSSLSYLDLSHYITFLPTGVLKGDVEFISPLLFHLFCHFIHLFTFLFVYMFVCLHFCLFVYFPPLCSTSFVILSICLPLLILLDYYLCTSTRKYLSDSITQVLMSLGYFHLPLSESNSNCLLNIFTMADD